MNLSGRGWLWRPMMQLLRPALLLLLLAGPALAQEAAFLTQDQLATVLRARGFTRLQRWSRGVDLARFTPEPRRDWVAEHGVARPVFLYVGRIAVEKNIEAFLALDLPGQNESPGPDDPAAYTPDRLAADVVAVAGALRARRPEASLHLVGHSFGGLVARAAVMAAPAAFDTLVLLDSGPAALGGVRRAVIEAMEPVLAASGVAGVYEATLALGRRQPSWVEPPPALARRGCGASGRRRALARWTKHALARPTKRASGRWRRSWRRRRSCCSTGWTTRRGASRARWSWAGAGWWRRCCGRAGSPPWCRRTCRRRWRG